MIGAVFGNPEAAREVVGLLEPQHFYVAAHRLLFEKVVEAHRNDEYIRPLLIASRCVKQLVRLGWGDDDEVTRRVEAIERRVPIAAAVDFAKIVKAQADRRALLDLAREIERQVADESAPPEEIAGTVQQTAMQVATSTLSTHDVYTMDERAEIFYRQRKVEIAAKADGVELGAWFDLPFLDNYLRGIRPGRTWYLAGDPGSGKSAVAWKAALKWAWKQAQRPRKLGTLVLSMEMGGDDSDVRLAQMMARFESEQIQDGTLSQAQLRHLMNQWTRGLPLYWNFSSRLRASQLRALVIEQIKRHNIGLVIIDHWKYFDMDRRYSDQNAEDEAKARFLREDIAKDLNTVVVCLAHTTKGDGEGRRPGLRDLRGSGLIGAHADYVSFMYRPYENLSDKQRASGLASPSDAEMIWAKNRHGQTGVADFYFEPSKMDIR